MSPNYRRPDASDGCVEQAVIDKRAPVLSKSNSAGGSGRFRPSDGEPPERMRGYYDAGISIGHARGRFSDTGCHLRGTIMSSSKHHKRKLAAALRMMGTSLATHTESTFKPSGAASRTLDEFKARRAAEKLGLLPPVKHKVAERFEIDVDTAQVTKLPVRAKSR
jgi:hypothetical protein